MQKFVKCDFRSPPCQRTCPLSKVSREAVRKALLKTEKERAKEPERRGRKPKLSKARVTGRFVLLATVRRAGQVSLC